MLSSIWLSITTLTLTALAYPEPQDVPIPNPQSTVGTLTNLTDGDVRIITCAEKGPKFRAHTIDCVQAVMQMPFIPNVISFREGSQPATIPFNAKVGRCSVSIDPVVPGGGDDASWLYTQVIGNSLINSCAGSFGSESRTGGEILFGRRKGLKMTFAKLPTPVGQNGTALGDDDDDVVLDSNTTAK